MDIYVVYRATNTTNGKAYVGYTKNLERRKTNHRNITSKLDYAFSRALRKYGWGSFVWDILCECAGKKEAVQKEIEFIASLKTFGVKGYNQTTGGEGGFATESHRNNVVARMVADNPMKSKSLEDRLAIGRKGAATRVELNQKRTPETKEKMRQARLKNNHRAVPIVIDGKSYPSISNAAIDLGMCRSTLSRRIARQAKDNQL